MSHYISTSRPNLLVGYECSGVMREAFRALGINAYSCDLKPAADNSPYHFRCSVFEVIDLGWDGAIYHPTCTFMTCSAEWAYKDPDYERYPGVGYHQKVKLGTLVGAARREAREKSLDEVRLLLGCKIPVKAVENPRGVIGTRIRPADQIIQPNWFGDDASKATCWWLEGFPLIDIDPAERCPGRIVEWPRGSGKFVERWSNQTDSGQNNLSPGEDRWADRSETYPGHAAACARSWAPTLEDIACLR